MKTERLQFSAVRPTPAALALAVGTLAASTFAAAVFDRHAGAAIIVWPASLVLAGAILLSLAAIAVLDTRGRIVLRDDALLVRHGFYTLRIARGRVGPVRTRVVDNLARQQLRPVNGLAIGGTLSGWFRTCDGRQVFCAVSAAPVTIFDFEGDARCPAVAVSCSREMAAAIWAWSRHAAHLA